MPTLKQYLVFYSFIILVGLGSALLENNARADTFLGEDVYTPPSWTVSNTPRDMLVVIYPTEPVNINVEGVDINAKETKNNEYIVLNQNIINFEGPF